ncbi:uncharacterized protein EV420DRAFT_1553680 [Desarmillaria tabescens]|uniref:BRCT domain-containing protein n=1 Tax=Armillaria tabescens TaxID=1929756 RepID=A0AA39K8L8_ARMTA|nr:uncharacterized protein EV420DRAFT_1553680 [Desarmillaria tabescens]KAK0455445.1 hypothetical protein EV420DRAFT_1553680 [Desarmillaria tabescens]
MAPARSSTRRGHIQPHALDAGSSGNHDLFIDPMLGTPLAVYIEKDVHDREALVNLITNNGGSVAPGYSGVTYILVDPLKPSGQNLYRQYVGKKGKIILDSRWIHECIKAGELQAFHTNWAGCKVTGNEIAPPVIEMQAGPSSIPQPQPQPQPQSQAKKRGGARQQNIPQIDQSARQIVPPQPLHPQALQPPAIPTVESLVHAQQHFQYPIYAMPPPRTMHAPPQTWQATTGIAPQQTHIAPPPPPPPPQPPHHVLRPDTWDYEPPDPDTNATPYDFRYRDEQSWVPPTHNPYYETPYENTYEPPPQNSYLEEPPSSSSNPPPPPPPAPPAPPVAPPVAPVAPAAPVEDESERSRGRKRTRTQSVPGQPTSALVPNRNPPARSPSPPSRVIKSTYGGNLFTAEDVQYLKKYIDYCQEEGLVLSLREICLRIAVKAPHHTFYSWRRYCNKHQIRLGGYMMNADRSQSPHRDEGEDDEDPTVRSGAGLGTISAAQQRVQGDNLPRTRSPTPPRALYRSTTGKGVAFTVDDIAFLIRFMEYRKSQERLDMVAFWKEVAARAPHHSRASWMKFWRRHKHELNRTDADEPLPQPPDKKMRYSREDDILLAKYFFSKPEGTSDQIFQAFGRMYPHHPWKGWQEHHRIHKVKIDHFIQQLVNGEDIGPEGPG